MCEDIARSVHVTVALAEIEVRTGLDQDCESCAVRLRDRLMVHAGVAAVDAVDERSYRVRYDPELCNPDCLTRAVSEVRADIAETFVHDVVSIGGMDCADCARTIEHAVARLDGVSFAAVHFAAGRLRVEYRRDRVSIDRVAQQVRGLGYQVDGAGVAGRGQSSWRSRDTETLVAAMFVAGGAVLDLAGGPSLAAHALYAAALGSAGWRIARAGVAALRATRRPDMNLLMALAAVGAAAIGAWLEAGLVVVLFALGQGLEVRAVERARRELEGLVALTPERARVRRGAHVVDVPASELAVGDLLVVRPGERFAADGTVLDGSSAVDEAAITGESVPVDKERGSRVFAGSLNGHGALVVEIATVPGDSTLARIGRLVAEAQARRSPSERWVDSFARWYTPVVIASAALVAVAPALAGWLSWQTSVYDGLALLILACPCALVISTPVSIVSALGRASAAGVLVKGGAFLEAAASVDTVAFDKTGTLTEGRPRVISVTAFGGSSPRALLALAASLEQSSEHPLARAIVAAAREQAVVLDPVADFTALVGLGAIGRIDGAMVKVGNGRLLDGELDDDARSALAALEDEGVTAVAVTREGVPVGVLGIADEPRAEAREALAQFARLGIRRTVMLTGDNEHTARRVATRIGIGDVRAELLPASKAAAVDALGDRVLMVGDGVNDAPALAAATLGVAMGTSGSDTAIEVADVALLGDDPRKAAGLVGLARFTRAVVRQNVAFSLATKLVAAGFLAFGALPLWAAVGSDVGASLIVIANGLRLLRGSPRGGSLCNAPMLAAAPRALRRTADAPESAGVAAPVSGCVADDCAGSGVGRVGGRCDGDAPGGGSA